MRVAIVAEAFLPNVNGVTNSVLRVLEHLERTGHEAIVIAPGARDHEEEITHYAGARIVRVPTVMVPLVNSLPVGVPSATVLETLAEFRPDVVHLASPFVLGAAGAFAARQLRIPAVAIYQTDVAGFSQRYHLAPLAAASWEWTRTIHNMCQRTLAPSSPTIDALKVHGINHIHRWGRGVDSVRFHPSKRSEGLRHAWDPTGQKKLVGFVGRLASEKGVHRLQAIHPREDVQLVIIGSGPEQDYLEQLLPNAHFMGALSGEKLAQAYASLDVLVHTGEFETFCQVVQEAQASGVPTIAPRAGGPVDLITPGKNGLLLDVDGFEDELGPAVDQLTRPDLLPALKESCRRGVRTRTWEALCEQLVGHYEAVISSAQEVPLTIIGQRPALPRWAQKALGARI